MLRFQVLHTFLGLRRYCRGSAPSCPSLGLFLTMRQDSLHVTAYSFCFHSLWSFHRASSLGSHLQMPASYKAAWSLPRLDFHQQVVPSLARRTQQLKFVLLVTLQNHALSVQLFSLMILKRVRRLIRKITIHLLKKLHGSRGHLSHEFVSW